MSVWDKILPHRFFINHALRTASNELRDHIDSYRREYELAIQHCRNEIEAAKAEKDQQFEIVKQEYLEKFLQDSKALDNLQALIFDYTDEYMKQKLCYLCREKLNRELQLLNEYGDFLTAQMKLIGEEITILEQRQESLTLQVKTDDIVALICVAGANLPCDDSDNPKTLLEKVNSILFESDDLLPQTKAALFKLHRLLQERAEYLPFIQYISWLIQQKKTLSKELSKERREVNKSKKPLKDQLLTIKAELDQLNKAILSKAICIRNIWAEPLADITVELAVVSYALNQQYSHQKHISEEIKTMKSEHSSDSDRWERLQVEGKTVYEAIGQLKGEKARLHEQRKQWRERRDAIMGLFKRNNVYLLSPLGEKISDEMRILRSRRTEFCEKIKAANQHREECIAQILNECQQQEAPLVCQLQAAERTVSEKKQCLAAAEKHIESCKKQDDRFFILCFFSESDDVVKAKSYRDKVQNGLSQAKQLSASLHNKLNAIHNDCEKRQAETDKQHQRKINGFQESVSNIDLAIAFIQKRK